MEENLETKKHRLKVQALLETNTTLTNSNADLRVEVTVVTDHAKALQNEVNRLNQELAEVRNGLVEETVPDATDPAS